MSQQTRLKRAYSSSEMTMVRGILFQQANGKVVYKECERYRSTKICCHSVAVAEKWGTLQKFYFLVQKKPTDNYCYEFPNKWHFKNSGEKGRSREVFDATRKVGRSKAQLSEKVTTVQRAAHLRHSHYHMYNPSKFSSYRASPLTTLLTRPNSPATTLVYPSGLPDQPPINRRNYLSPSYGSFVIYPLSMCTRQVSTCYGCSAPLKTAGQIAPPPGDQIIVSNMLRSCIYSK